MRQSNFGNRLNAEFRRDGSLVLADESGQSVWMHILDARALLREMLAEYGHPDDPRPRGWPAMCPRCNVTLVARGRDPEDGGPGHMRRLICGAECGWRSEEWRAGKGVEDRPGYVWPPHEEEETPAAR